MKRELILQLQKNSTPQLLNAISVFPPKNIVLKAGFILAVIFFALPAAQVLAANITVDDDCSLANAIRSANGAAQEGAKNSCEAGDSGSDTIILTGDITLTAAPPSITTEVVIEGGNYAITGGAYQTFSVGGNVTINNLTFTGSNFTDVVGRESTIVTAGGSLTINNSKFDNNYAHTESSAINNLGSTVHIKNSIISNNGSGGAGVLYNGSTMTIENSVLINNAGVDGGVIRNTVGSTLTIKKSVFSGNSARDQGGAIYNEGTLTIENSTFYGNSIAAADTGIIVINSSSASATLKHVTLANSTDGIGLLVTTAGAGATMTVQNSIFADNTDGDCAGFSLANTANLVKDGSCSALITGDPELGGPTGSPAHLPLGSGSPAIGKGPSNCLATDQRGASRPSTGCDLGAVQYYDPPSERASQAEERESAASPEERAAATPRRVSTCETALPASIVVSGIRSSGTQCSHLDATGIGIPSVIESGFIDAVDVWGYLGAGVEVCFHASGSLVFLDASTAPRSVSSLAAYSKDGMTCAFIEHPGTVVLVPGPAPDPLPPPAQNLGGCMVSTTDMLNFRAAPGGQVIDILPYDVTLTALARTDDWFQVDYHGIAGWISADYVKPEGNCG